MKSYCVTIEISEFVFKRKKKVLCLMCLINVAVLLQLLVRGVTAIRVIALFHSAREPGTFPGLFKFRIQNGFQNRG